MGGDDVGEIEIERERGESGRQVASVTFLALALDLGRMKKKE